MNKNKITYDWLLQFPTFHKYKNLWIVKKVECVIFGIYIELPQNSTSYKVIFHIHCILQSDLYLFFVNGNTGNFSLTLFFIVV